MPRKVSPELVLAAVHKASAQSEQGLWSLGFDSYSLHELGSNALAMPSDVLKSPWSGLGDVKLDLYGFQRLFGGRYTRRLVDPFTVGRRLGHHCFGASRHSPPCEQRRTEPCRQEHGSCSANPQALFSIQQWTQGPPIGTSAQARRDIENAATVYFRIEV